MKRWIISFVFFCLAILVISWQPLRRGLERNLAALSSIRGILGDDASQLQAANLAWAKLAGSVCRGNWHLGLIYDETGQPGRRDAAWQDAVACSGENVDLLRAKFPLEETYALYAVSVQPAEAAAWFWLADSVQAADSIAAIRYYWQGLSLQPGEQPAWVNLGRLLAALPPSDAPAVLAELELTQAQPASPRIQAEKLFILGAAYRQADKSKAIDLYRKGLALSPSDGIRWYELGDMLAADLPQEALEAYYQACLFGDPGKHGCYNAGRMAEKQGTIDEAIRYYRMSDWAQSLERARELETQTP